MEKKQSSVEWLYERLERMIPRTALYNIDKKQFLEQAKAMHKEEMFEYIKQKYCIGQMSLEFHTLEFEQYYTETFGGDNEN